MAGFEYRGQLNGAENPVTLPISIGTSKTVKVGDALVMDALGDGGGCERASAGTKVLGICIGITNKDGIDLDNANSGTYDGTWTSATKVYAASSDNMTDKEVKAQVVVDTNALWYNDSAGDTAAADIAKFFDLTDQDQIADQNGHDTAGAFILIKRDPDGDADASKGIFKVSETAFHSYTQG